MYLLPKASVTNVVVKAEADILTILLPISMALSIFEGLSTNLSSRFAFLLPSFAMNFNLCLLTVVNAVSAEEKNAESNNNNNKIINLIMELGSNSSSPNIFIRRFYLIIVTMSSKVKLTQNKGIKTYMKIDEININQKNGHNSIVTKNVLKENGYGKSIRNCI